MKYFLSSVLVLMAVVFFHSANSRAAGFFGGNQSSSWDGFHGGGNVKCAAFDTGWEEHWGGHSSCGVCLAKHQHCVEKCSRTGYNCKTEGVASDGNLAYFEAYSDYSEYQARDQALNRCYSSGAQHCVDTGCNQTDEVVSRNSCN